MHLYHLSLSVFVFGATVLLSAQNNMPAPGQTLWDYNTSFLAQPNALLGLDEEGSASALHQKFMLQWEPRLFPSGDFGLLKTATEDYLQYIAGHPKDATTFPSNWTSLGPLDSPQNSVGQQLSYSTGTGQIHAIAFDPGYFAKHTVYCASSYGGLFKSMDSGASWASLTDHALPFTPVSDIVVLDSSPATLFISTGSSDGVLSYSSGVWRSMDAGATWENISSTLLLSIAQREHIFCMDVLQGDPNVAFIGTSEGIFKTENALATNASDVVWTSTFNSPTGNFWKSLTFLPGNPDVLYASDRDVYRTLDQGQNWLPVTGAGTGLDLQSPPWTGPAAERINLATSLVPGNENTLHALVQSGNNYVTNAKSYAFRFDHGTAQWSAPATVETASSNVSVGWIPLAASPDPLNAEVVAYGSLRLFRSLDNGVSIQTLSQTLAANTSQDLHDDKQVLAFCPDGSELWVGNHGGLHRTLQPYATSPTWETRNAGLATGLVEQMASNPASRDAIISGEFDNGIRRWVPEASGSNKWRHLKRGDGGTVRFSLDGQHAYGVDLRYTPIYKWVNNSLSESPPSANQSGWWAANGHRAIEIDDNDGLLYVGYTDLWKEPNMAAAPSDFTSNAIRLTHWQNGDQSLADFPDSDFPCNTAVWRDAVIAPSNADYYYIATPGNVCGGDIVGSKLLRTMIPIEYNANGKPRLEYGTMPFPDINVTQLEVDPVNPNRIWVVLSGFAADRKVYYSDQRGDAGSWVNWDPNSTLPNLSVNDIVYQRGTQDGLYIAMDVGVYFRDATSEDWEPFFEDLPNVQVNDLDINYCAGKVRAGTYGRGLWESDLAEKATI
jgi:hypothetical protein